MMPNKAYEKLNELQVEYHDMALSDEEKIALETMAKQYAKKNHKKRLRWSVVATCVAIMCIGISLGVPSVGATISNIFAGVQTSFSTSFAKPDQADAYTTNLHQFIDLGDRSVQIEDIALDGDDMYVSMLFEGSDNPLDGSFEGLEILAVEINDKKIRVMGSSGQSGAMQEGSKVHLSALKHSLAKTPEIDETKEKQAVKLYCYAPESGKTLSFAFTIDTKKLLPETKTVLTNFMIPKTDIMVESFRLNALAQKIVLSYHETEQGGIYSLVGTDDKGKKVVFETRDGDKTRVSLHFEPLSSEITATELLENTKSLTLRLERQAIPEKSGKFDTPIEKIGEPFEVKLQ